ncbi:MAG: T9SS type A sorting domain-containing protein [Bacteroidota bacterium]
MKHYIIYVCVLIFTPFFLRAQYQVVTNADPVYACSGTIEVTVNGDAGPFILVVSGVNSSGANIYNSGSITLEDGTSKSLNNLCNGDYTIEITDIYGCHKYFNESIETCEMSANFNFDITPYCGDGDPGTQFGSIEITSIPAGVGTFSYLWSTGSDQSNISLLQPGKYIVTITDESGCKLKNEFTINNSGYPDVDIERIGYCASDSSDYFLTPLDLNGNEAYTYQWSNGSKESELINVPTQSYTVTVTNENGCQVIKTIDEGLSGDSDGELFADFSLESAESCLGASDGSFSVCPTYLRTIYNNNGGIIITEDIEVPMNFLIYITDQNDNTVDYFIINSGVGESCSLVSDLSAGIYNVKIIMNYCTDIFEFEIPQLEPTFSMNVEVTNEPNCDGTSDGVFKACVVDLNNTNNEPSHVIIRDPNNAIIYNSDNDPDLTLCESGMDGLASGVYTFTITKGPCTVTQEYHFEMADPEFEVEAEVNHVCADNLGNGGLISLEIEPEGVYSISWEGCPTCTDVSQESMNVIDELTPGTYTAIITDQNNCSIHKAIQVQQGDALEFEFDYSYDGDCWYSEYEVNIINAVGNRPFIYEWSNGMTGSTISGVEPGTYTVTATDQLGCKKFKTLQLGNSIPTSGVIPVVTRPCNADLSDGMVEVLLNTEDGEGYPPYTYSFFGEILNDSESIPFHYTSDSPVFPIAYSDQITFRVGVTDQLGCLTKSNLVSIIGQRYSVEEDLIIPENADVPNSGQIHTNITVLESDWVETAESTNSIGPYTYLWSNGAMDADLINVPAGVYQVTVTDGRGCYAYGEFEVPSCSDAGPMDLSHKVVDIDCIRNEASGRIVINIPRESNDLVFFMQGEQIFPPFTVDPEGSYYRVVVTNVYVPGTYELSVFDDCGRNQIIDYEVHSCEDCVWRAVIKNNNQCDLLNNENIKVKKINDLPPDYEGSYYIKFVKEGKPCPVENAAFSDYHGKLDSDGVLVEGIKKFSLHNEDQGNGEVGGWCACVYDEQGCNQRECFDLGAEVSQCWEFPQKSQSLNSFWDNEEDIDPRVLNKTASTKCSENRVCLFPPLIQFDKTFLYLPIDPDNPCDRGVIQCAHWNGNKEECDDPNGYGRYDIYNGLANGAIHVTGLSGGECGCFFPKGTASPYNEYDLFVTFDCGAGGPIEPSCDVTITVNNEDQNAEHFEETVVACGEDSDNEYTVCKEVNYGGCYEELYCDDESYSFIKRINRYADKCYSIYQSGDDNVLIISAYCELTNEMQIVEIIENGTIPNDMPQCEEPPELPTVCVKDADFEYCRKVSTIEGKCDIYRRCLDNADQEFQYWKTLNCSPQIDELYPTLCESETGDECANCDEEACINGYCHDLMECDFTSIYYQSLSAGRTHRYYGSFSAGQKIEFWFAPSGLKDSFYLDYGNGILHKGCSILKTKQIITVGADAVLTLTAFGCNDTPTNTYRFGWNCLSNANEEEEIASRNSKLDDRMKPEILVYPNPFTNEFIVDLKTYDPENVQIQCLDMFGKEVLRKSVLPEHDPNQISINMDSYPSGIYYLRVQKDNKMIAVQKVIKI